MLYILPFLTWLAAIASAGYCQFFAGSPVVAAAGIALQTILAIGLILRFRLDTWSRGRVK